MRQEFEPAIFGLGERVEKWPDNEREGQAMAELLFAALILGAPFPHCAAALFSLAHMRFAPSAGTSQTDVAGRP